MASQHAAATRSWAHHLIRRPAARLAIAIAASTQYSTPTAIRFRLPGRPSSGVRSRPASSGSSAEEG